ncbi:hypothetical protein GCM10025868_39400 [Angustibacter aerolatus]|uniref:glycogen phosphorylase n=1 Tax=Angustibacter aerolatus TaxID=1162965 RepID=A0ABQ6JPP4_9ACTN|nr:alpha-glucan family phosphorylase [Angustibacter aerolatus]GMA88690.1 hypothetical protein GCM10025868_39400 [Angustibacter aerolatus]
MLDPDVLTIGFARRVPTYKRLTLMLRDPDRLRALLLDPERPVQIVIAGKSHPADDKGKSLIQQMVRFADDAGVRHRIVFLPNYDIAMAQYLYPGCDVWLNNPLRPFEACGTSGMKAALNGGLNLSILDGWWDEWFDGENGWAIPTADEVEDADHRDDLEAAALYDLIEGQVAPRFYARDEETGLPGRWLEMVGHTLSTLGPKVLATRQVTDYVEQPVHPGEPQRPGAGAGRLRGRPRPRVVEGAGARQAGGRARRPRRVDRRQRLAAGRRRAVGAGVRVARRSATGGRRGAGRPRPRHLRRRDRRQQHGRARARRGVRGRPAPVRGRPAAGPHRVLRLHRAGATEAHRAGQPGRAWGSSRTPDPRAAAGPRRPHRADGGGLRRLRPVVAGPVVARPVVARPGGARPGGGQGRGRAAGQRSTR